MQTITTSGISNAVADTLFITLYMRCRETRRPDAIIRDPEACALVECLDYDFSKFDKGDRSQVGTCLRVKHFDAVTRQFIESNDDPVVVSIGCGLDNRSRRVGLDKGIYYNLDLPEVMALRDKLMPPDARNVAVRRSMFDREWLRDIRDKHPKSRVLVIAEGVFMYFPEKQIRPVIEGIAKTLAPGELLFDASTSFGCKLSSRHDTVKHTRASFQWPLDEDNRLETWAENLKLLGVEYFMDKEKRRWGISGRVLSLVPAFAKSFRMLHYRMDPASPESC